MTRYLTTSEGRASPADCTAVVAMTLLPFALEQERPSSTGILCKFRLMLWRSGFAIPRSQASPVDFTATVTAALSGPNFTRRHFDVGFCRSTPLCDSRRPNFISRHCDCVSTAPGVHSALDFGKNFCKLFSCFLRSFGFSQIKLNPLSCQILYQDSVSMMV